MGLSCEARLQPKGVRLPRSAAARRLHLEPRRLHHGNPQPRQSCQGSGLRVFIRPRSAAAEGRHRSADQPPRDPVNRRARGRRRGLVIAMSAQSVVLHEVKKAFPLGGGRDLEVLDVAHLALAPGSCTVLRGRSGSGKTTLLNLIAGITAPSAGAIRVDDTDLFALPQARRDRFRAENVGYVFQTFNLLSALSAIENVVLAMMFAGTVPRRLQRRRAADLLARLGLSERLGHKPAQLSRGEQQRVAIARALANRPPLVLADEPCASLDARRPGTHTGIGPGWRQAGTRSRKAPAKTKEIAAIKLTLLGAERLRHLRFKHLL